MSHPTTSLAISFGFYTLDMSLYSPLQEEEQELLAIAAVQKVLQELYVVVSHSSSSFSSSPLPLPPLEPLTGVIPGGGPGGLIPPGRFGSIPSMPVKVQ